MDSGSTVMDYLSLERERGITILSAVISFSWAGHTLNLVDTPGHADFTFEVERSLRVLDGAIALLDASSGVEVRVQTCGCLHDIMACACRHRLWLCGDKPNDIAFPALHLSTRWTTPKPGDSESALHILYM